MAAHRRRWALIAGIGLLGLPGAGCCLFQQPVPVDLSTPEATFEHLRFAARRTVSDRHRDFRFSQALHREAPSVLIWNTLSYEDQDRGLWRFQTWAWPYIRKYAFLLEHSRIDAVEDWERRPDRKLLVVTLFCPHRYLYSVERILLVGEPDREAGVGGRESGDGMKIPNPPSANSQPPLQWHLAPRQPFTEGSRFLGAIWGEIRRDWDDSRGVDDKLRVPPLCSAHAPLPR